MRQQTFYDWLLREVASSRMALISLYESRDRILYIEAPTLRKKYIGIFGEIENAVLQSELETALLRRKVELIQTAINRREKIDLDQIEAQIKDEREHLLSQLEQNDVTLNELPQLSDEQTHTLQRLYHEITSCFHPAMNSDLTETQKDLYQKALEAFKMQDVDAMKIIHDSLFVERDFGSSFQVSTPIPQEEKDERADYRSVAYALMTDYSLAKKLYSFFAPLEDDYIVLNYIRDCDSKRKEVEEEIARIKAQFPFNAVDTMNSKSKAEEYFAELRLRASKSETEKHELQRKIEKLMERQTNG